MLFRGKNATSRLQRSFTGAHYDHVGLLLKYSDGSIVLFEATGTEGVGLVTWSRFLKNRWNLLYHKLILRHLIYEREEPTFQENVETFVKRYLGNKYSVSPTKLLRAKSILPGAKGAPADKDRTFFCSELVAAAYKDLGFLDPVKASSKYWPGSFAAKNRKFKLLDGALLADELLIDFRI